MHSWLELHSFHHAAFQKLPSPLSMQAIERAAGFEDVQPKSMPDIEYAARLALRCASLRGSSESPLPVQLDAGCLHITLKETKITIPLVLSEAFCLQDGAKYVLSVLVQEASHAASPSCEHSSRAAGSLQQGTGIWLFSACGNLSSLSGLMDAWSRMGVIRSDLSESFVVKDDILGFGGYATVHLGRPRRSHCESFVAMKFLDTDEDFEAAALREVGFMLAVQGHPSVPVFRGLFKHFYSAKTGDEGNCGGVQWVLVLDYCAQGDLFDHLMRAPSSRLTDAEAKPLIGGILSGLAHIHQVGIIHRDIKPDNILLAEDGRPVVSDFGIAVQANDEASKAKILGSPGYCGPEMLRGNRYGTNFDVFGVGCILYQLLTGHGPFHASTPHKAFVKNRAAKISFRNRKLHDAKGFLAELLAVDPALRPSAARALCNSWLCAASALAQDEVHTPPKDEMGMLKSPIMRFLSARFSQWRVPFTSKRRTSSFDSVCLKASRDCNAVVRQPCALRSLFSCRNLQGRSKLLSSQPVPSEPLSPATGSTSHKPNPPQQQPMPPRASAPSGSDVSSSVQAT
eukprot:TRINITY_DN6672_c0_g1_i1.p1 TRINITY_DN6672_c0_g1~~TRINITY_DN6672_c0_g1_i1.p1  ORF type:complete len:569 (-),score=92.05 TRINITY_DN6672_c0_g1_i1:312-2018(-)